MKNKTGQLFLHITGCIAFLSLPVLLSPDVAWNFHFIRLPPFQEDFISYTLLLLFFYLNYFVLIPRFYFKQKLLLYIGCSIASYLLIAALPHIIVPGNHAATAQHHEPGGMNQVGPSPPPGGNIQQPPGLPGDHPPPDMQRPEKIQPRPDKPVFTPRDSAAEMPANNAIPGMPPRNSWTGAFRRIPHFEYLFQFMMILVLSALIRINNRLKQTEKEKVNAELSYLKAQINPHFLFNTLNSIYSSAIEENADTTASAVVKLSGMMRYVISEAHHAFVPLNKELSYISDYIELQKIRLGETVKLQYSVSGATAAKQIAPLILISFIENAFKHGVNPEENSSIDIEIIINGNNLHLTVLNNKVKTVKDEHADSHVGLENTRNRLILLYPNRHELVIKEDEKEYMVLLKIELA